MGGVVNTVKSAVKNPIGFAGRTALGAITGGMSEIGGSKSLGSRIMGLGASSGGGTSSEGTTIGGSQTPMEMLVNTGGAPLLANIAMGANIDDSLSSFLGVPKDQLNSIDGIDSLRSQLTSIQTNTDMKNKAVQQLANDFPNFMAATIPKYKGIADQATMDAAQHALDQTAAKYAAGGSISSGAMDAAMARTAASTAQENLGFGTSLALQDFNQQFSEASALRDFQMKMLGQTSTQGFNAVQNALSGNRTIDLAQANLNARQSEISNQNTQDMFGAIGKAGIDILAPKLFGPIGTVMGNNLSNSLFGNSSGVGSSPKLVTGNSAVAGTGA